MADVKKTATAKVAEVKEVAKKEEAKVVEAAKTVETKAKETAEKAKTTAKTTAAKAKTTAKKTATTAKTAAKKTATTAKTAAKKTATTAKATVAAKKSPVVPEIYVQAGGNQAELNTIIENVKKHYIAEGGKTISKVEIYLKPEDGAAYYVINGKNAGRVNLF